MNITIFQHMIYRFSIFNICTNQFKPHGILKESLNVEWIIFNRHIIICHLLIYQITCSYPGTESTISGIFCKPFIVSQCTSYLFGFVVTSESCSSRNAYNAIKMQFVFHENIQYAYGIHASHSTTL